MKCPACGTAELTNGRTSVCQGCSLAGLKPRDEVPKVDGVSTTYTVKIPFPFHVPTTLADLAQEELEAELPKTVERVLREAEANGWVLSGKGMIMGIRLDKPDDDNAVPFYCSWQLVIAKDGKRRWQFTGAAAANWQPLTFHDVFTYLKDPSVIWPEDITEEGK